MGNWIDSLANYTGSMGDKIVSMGDKTDFIANQTAKYSSYFSFLGLRIESIMEQLTSIREQFQSTREIVSTEPVRDDQHKSTESLVPAGDAPSPVPLETSMRSSRSRCLSQAGLLDPILENEEQDGQSKASIPPHSATMTFQKGIVWHSKIATIRSMINQLPRKSVKIRGSF
jgi:hypothetical protein